MVDVATDSSGGNRGGEGSRGGRGRRRGGPRAPRGNARSGAGTGTGGGDAAAMSHDTATAQHDNLGPQSASSQNQLDSSSEQGGTSSRRRGGGGPRRGRGRGGGGGGGGGGSVRGGRRQGAAENEGGSSIAVEAKVDDRAPPSHNHRRRQFASKLTSTDTDGQSSNVDESGTEEPRAGHQKSRADGAPKIAKDYADLRTRLVAELSSGQYDCSVCYSTVTTKQAVWSCSQCYVVLHLNCVERWASSSVAKIEEQNAMQEDPALRDRKGTWRCPSCQYAREPVPRTYMCWDGQMRDPVGGRGAPPHSCGRGCNKTKCSHGCAAGLCHPGPCPPCPVSITNRCFCGAEAVTTRCSQIRGQPLLSRTGSGSSTGGVSCGGICGKPLSCGFHQCNDICHEGECAPCQEVVSSKCYCGRHEKDMRCGEGVSKTSVESVERSWEGRWTCSSRCERLFDCGVHACQRACHPINIERPPCPFSPAFVTTCPCGAEPLEERKSCQDPIPTCSRTCSRQLSCGHTCQTQCHLGDCPPCSIIMPTPCRCGETKKPITCHEKQREESEGGREVLCTTTCRSLRNCGRHECRRTCCPLYFLAKSKSRKKPSPRELEEQDPAGLHNCDVPCAKPLKCGLHSCPMTCHRGPCPPCLQASFEELACHCGRTVLDPPVPCGTVVRCHFPCARPPPPCGHPKQQHDCHEDEHCPPCIFLVQKRCLCGKNIIPNVPCHRSRVSCGQTCDTVLNCGFHRCQQLCHQAGECGPCSQTCTKPRKCGHPCPEKCHAPAACPETEPCMAWVTLQCACGNIQQRARCGASIHSPVQPDRKLKCTDACLIAQRNIKLAEALGLNPAEKAAPTKYENSTLAYYGSNKRFAEEVESTLIDFIRSSRHGLILPPANRAQRQFTHELADAFKLVSESVDAEPRRSVSIRRKQESKVPHPLLSEAHRTYRAESGHGSALGQLRRSNPSSAAPSSSSEDGLAIARENRFPLNAVLLEGVFGHDEPSLRAILQPLLRTAGTLQLRWVGDEDVLVSSDNPSRLVASRTELRSLLYRVDMPAGRVASAILLVHADARGNIVRVETTNPAPASATVGNAGNAAAGNSSASHGRMATGTTGAWAAVAASNPGLQATKSPAPSAWGGASPALAQAPASAPLTTHPRLQNWLNPSASVSATASANTSPRPQASPMLTSPQVQPSLPFIDNSSIPDEWDDSVDAL